jgi:leader peptidase (prepilin peptidase)/N-methyltransferase
MHYVMNNLINLSIFVFGASIGSFLNVLIDRLPNNENINGRSHCDYCKKKIPWYDLFPIISFFVLGGETRCCKKKMSFQYPLIETITGIVFVLISNLQFTCLAGRQAIFKHFSHKYTINIG